MYRYKVIDIHPIDRLYGVIKVGQVLEAKKPAALMAWDSRRPEISGYSYGFIAGETVAAIKVEDITYQKEEVEPAPWIPVSERLPEFDESVLVFCRIYGRFLATYVQVGEFDGQKYGNWRDFKGQLGILPPTHWMPLPEPPKK